MFDARFSLPPVWKSIESIIRHLAASPLDGNVLCRPDPVFPYHKISERNAQMKQILLYGALVIVGVPVLYLVVGIFVWPFIEAAINPPELFEIQSEYRGWVIIQYGVELCPPLERRGRTLVHKVPLSGCLCTSNPSQEEWHDERFEYVNASGIRTRLFTTDFSGPDTFIWDEGTATINPPHGKSFSQKDFFVGSKQDREARTTSGANAPSSRNEKTCDELEEVFHPLVR